MKVEEFMITDVISVTEDESVKELLKAMVENKIGGLPVVDHSNSIKGMVTDGDVIRFLNPKGRTVYDMFSIVVVTEKEELQQKLDYAVERVVDDMMKHREIYYVKPDDHLDTAISIFSKHRFKKIPVVDDNNRVVGVISRGDVIRFITNQLL